jgi:hypothetical protein
MQDEADISFLQQRGVRISLLVIIFIIGFFTRLPRITERGFTFHSIREYRSALIARQFYYKDRTDLSERKRRVLEAQYKPWLEPPIMEKVNAFAYAIAGGERIWIPRIISIFIWLAGGLGLYLLAARLLPISSALCALAFYLYLPYALIASRSFQPDPLMVALMIFSLYAILLYHESPSVRKLVIAAVVSAAAITIKPPAAFFIFGVFLALLISRGNARKELISRNTIIFVAVAIGLGLLYYIISYIVSPRIISQADGSFVPQLLFKKILYVGWHLQLGAVFGYPILVVVLTGLFFIKPGTPRAFILGAWCAYVVFGLIFTYHIYSHSYYHLPLIPIAAISFGALTGELIVRAYNTSPKTIARIALLLICIFAVVRTVRDAELVYYETEEEVAAAVKMGDKVNHSIKVVTLDWTYGRRLEYEGWIAGKTWPSKAGFALQFRGKKIQDSVSIFKKEYLPWKPEFFIITRLKDFDGQPYLKQWLDDNYLLYATDRLYRIYDLRKEKGTETPPEKDRE